MKKETLLELMENFATMALETRGFTPQITYSSSDLKWCVRLMNIYDYYIEDEVVKENGEQPSNAKLQTVRFKNQVLEIAVAEAMAYIEHYRHPLNKTVELYTLK